MPVYASFQRTPRSKACLPTMPPSPPLNLFDSHAHLDAPEFDADRAQVLQRARAAGVMQILIPAVDAASWPQLAALCASDPLLYPAYGMHPCYLAKHQNADLSALDAWLQNHPAVAIGECGLDYSEPTADRPRQLALLHGHLEIAQRTGLPLILHARHAFEPLILELRRFGKPLHGVVHSFSGSAEQARALQKLGFMVGIGGPVTYARAQRLRRVVAALPIESLLLETDSPDQPDADHRGQRNEPARLVDVLHCIAALRDVSPTELANHTAANARRLFIGTN